MRERLKPPRKYRFVASAPVVLGATGSPAGTCIIGFSVDAAKLPAGAADPATPGIQTVRVALAHGVGDGGLRATGIGSNELTLSPSATAAADEPPTAAYTPSTSRRPAGRPVSFDATASSDPDGTTTAYRWLWETGPPTGAGRARRTRSRRPACTPSGSS